MSWTYMCFYQISSSHLTLTNRFVRFRFPRTVEFSFILDGFSPTDSLKGYVTMNSLSSVNKLDKKRKFLSVWQKSLQTTHYKWKWFCRSTINNSYIQRNYVCLICLNIISILYLIYIKTLHEHIWPLQNVFFTQFSLYRTLWVNSAYW